MQKKPADAPQNVSESVLNYLKSGITSGKWKAGERIPTEHQLCQTLNVSRVSVRTAIHQLSTLGILRSVRGSGTYVCAAGTASPLASMLPALVLNQDDLLSMLEFRKILEVETAGLVALRATTEDVEEMLRSAERMKLAETQADIARYDLAFHALIAKASRNFAIIKVFDILRESYSQILDCNVSMMGPLGADDHRRIAAAIAMRNPEQVKRLMREHLDRSAQYYFCPPAADTQPVRL